MDNSEVVDAVADEENFITIKVENVTQVSCTIEIDFPHWQLYHYKTTDILGKLTTDRVYMMGLISAISGVRQAYASRQMDLYPIQVNLANPYIYGVLMGEIPLTYNADLWYILSQVASQIKFEYTGSDDPYQLKVIEEPDYAAGDYYSFRDFQVDVYQQAVQRKLLEPKLGLETPFDSNASTWLDDILGQCGYYVTVETFKHVLTGEVEDVLTGVQSDLPGADTSAFKKLANELTQNREESIYWVSPKLVKVLLDRIAYNDTKVVNS